MSSKHTLNKRRETEQDLEKTSSVMPRRSEDEQRSFVKNSHSSRDNRRDGHNRQGHQRVNTGKFHDAYHRQRRSAEDESRADRGVDRRRERDEQRPKRRERPPSADEEAEEPSDSGKPSWQNTKVRKHAEMLKERKLLWKGKSGDCGEQQQKQQEEEEETAKNDKRWRYRSGELASERKGKQEHKWQSMIAATAQDTQQMDKFQRLMGMKKSTTSTPTEPSSLQSEAASAVHGTEAELNSAELERERVRQLEQQRGLNQQFELARHSHHGAPLTHIGILYASQHNL
uniref:SMAP domain-containing protein n=1 Tax=Globodera pallida TaxID=36090 RepID=A0A183BQE1_GLOPA